MFVFAFFFFWVRVDGRYLALRAALLSMVTCRPFEGFVSRTRLTTSCARDSAGSIACSSLLGAGDPFFIQFIIWVGDDVVENIVMDRPLFVME